MESWKDHWHGEHLPGDDFRHGKDLLINLRYLKYQVSHNYFIPAGFFHGAVAYRAEIQDKTALLEYDVPSSAQALPARASDRSCAQMPTLLPYNS